MIFTLMEFMLGNRLFIWPIVIKSLSFSIFLNVGRLISIAFMQSSCESPDDFRAATNAVIRSNFISPPPVGSEIIHH